MPIPLGILAAAGFSPAVAGGSYDLLETTVVGGPAVASVEFTNLGQYASTYQHLQLRTSLRSSVTGLTNAEVLLQFNTDSGNNYSKHRLYGTGSAVGSQGFASTNGVRFGVTATATSTSNYAASVSDILDPFESKNTTVRTLSGQTDGNIVELNSGAWLNTASITSLKLLIEVGGNFVSGSRVSLYGVK